MTRSIKQSGKITKQREEAIDRVLTYISLSESMPLSGNKQDIGNKIPPKAFSGMQIWPLYESMQDTTRHQRLFFPPEDPDLFEPKLLPTWDACTAFFEPKGSDPGYLFSALRFRRAAMPSIRGMFKLRTGEVFECLFAAFYNSGYAHTTRKFLEHIGKGDLDLIGDPYPPPKRAQRMRVDRDDELWQSLWLHKSLALTSDYDWIVQLGYRRNNSPLIAIPTDPISARDIFKLRDIPTGASRRTALRHWVEGHTRGSKTQAEYTVSPHLRGAEEFHWNGLDCIIQPSPHDLRLASRLRAIAGDVAQKGS
jgi:hypothetical protein